MARCTEMFSCILECILMPLLLQGKGFLGFVSNAVGHNNSRIQVEFTHPDTNETVPSIRLKAQGQHAAEEMPLYVITDKTKICGQVCHQDERMPHANECYMRTCPALFLLCR